jgi:Vault protein inter-alpha-trypsin domain
MLTRFRRHNDYWKGMAMSMRMMKGLIGLSWRRCMLLASLFCCAVPVFAAVHPQLPIHVVPRLIVPEAHLAVRLQKVAVRAEVLGSAAHTRIEMVFYNPNERMLEGELQFPVLDGQTVTGFSLDINGELRPAVPVDKARGQQVFEDVSRARIDPALLAKTQGNNYKLRVYPLPPHGTRRVLLELDETLSGDSLGVAYKGIHNTTYRLPLQFGAAVEQLWWCITQPHQRHDRPWRFVPGWGRSALRCHTNRNRAFAAVLWSVLRAKIIPALAF